MGKGECGMYLLGTFVVDALGENGEDLDFFTFPELDSSIGADALDAPIDGFCVAAAGKNQEGGKEMAKWLGTAAAADAEDALGKHPVTPGSILPVREQLADLLLEQGDSSGALAEYERALVATPGRLLALYGAARAADRARDAPRTRAYFEKVVAVAGAGDARDEVREARAWLGAHAR